MATKIKKLIHHISRKEKPKQKLHIINSKKHYIMSTVIWFENHFFWFRGPELLKLQIKINCFAFSPVAIFYMGGDLVNLGVHWEEAERLFSRSTRSHLMNLPFQIFLSTYNGGEKS